MTCARALVALLSALALALAPIAAQIHQTFANHRHVYCPVHQRFEDAGPRDVLAGEPAAPAEGAFAGHPGSDTRHACVLSNVLLQLAASERPLPFAGELAAGERGPGRVSLAPPAPIALRHLAPKHSPPAALA
jgi:hypothetical protein